MKLAEKVRDGYRERERSGNWAKWTIDNPDLAELLPGPMEADE